LESVVIGKWLWALTVLDILYMKKTVINEINLSI